MKCTHLRKWISYNTTLPLTYCYKECFTILIFIISAINELNSQIIDDIFPQALHITTPAPLRFTDCYKDGFMILILIFSAVDEQNAQTLVDIFPQAILHLTDCYKYGFMILIFIISAVDEQNAQTLEHEALQAMHIIPPSPIASPVPERKQEVHTDTSSVLLQVPQRENMSISQPSSPRLGVHGKIIFLTYRFLCSRHSEQVVKELTHSHSEIL